MTADAIAAALEAARFEARQDSRMADVGRANEGGQDGVRIAPRDRRVFAVAGVVLAVLMALSLRHWARRDRRLGSVSVVLTDEPVSTTLRYVISLTRSPTR
ncbi:hypothetical protein [Streptomyces sp. NPDC000133]|uniref:hypothetical protein n=1 Tax=Streptomyces sp. NPDC000133 TaxID=3364535 RepID=UPI0036CC2824